MASRYSYPQIICNITDIGFQHITCDIGLSVGRYFGIDNRLSVLPIFDCDNMLSRHFHLPNHLLYRLILWILGIGICQYWRVFHPNFDISTTCNSYFWKVPASWKFKISILPLSYKLAQHQHICMLEEFIFCTTNIITNYWQAWKFQLPFNISLSHMTEKKRCY